MKVIAFLLIIYYGGHAGFISVPDLADEVACEVLASKLGYDLDRKKKGNKGPTYMGDTGYYSCLSYEKAR